MEVEGRFDQEREEKILYYDCLTPCLPSPLFFRSTWTSSFDLPSVTYHTVQILGSIISMPARFCTMVESCACNFA
jgi:hypothetical protein